MYLNNEQTFVARERAQHVNHTPADLGGLTSFLYELELSAKLSLPVFINTKSKNKSDPSLLTYQHCMLGYLTCNE